MTIKKMITNLKSFDCKTNSSCKHLVKYIENSMENMHILLLGCEQPFSDLFMNDFSSAGEKLLNKNLRSTRLSYTPNAEITRMVKKYGNNSSNDVHPNWQRTSRNCNSCKRDLRDILIYQQKFRLNTGLCVTIFYTIAVIFVGWPQCQCQV